jgi:hypothetical protein
MLLYFLALFTYENFTGEQQIALELWERILGMEEAENVGYKYLPYAKYLVITKLSTVYFEKALATERGSEEAAFYVKHLEQLAETTDEISDWSDETYTKQLLARYYALTE